MKINDFFRSFRFAYEGLIYVLMTQRNMQIHFVMAFVVCTAGFFLQLDRTEILFLMFAIVLVIISEMFNTAIEKTVDLASPEWHVLAKIAKDVAAGAVMVTSLFSLVVGMVVFFPVIDRLLNHESLRDSLSHPGNVWLLWVAVSIVMVVVIGIQTWMAKHSQQSRIIPSLVAAVSFAMSTLISVLAPDTRVILISFTLAGLCSLITLDKHRSNVPAIAAGATVGALLPLFFILLAKLFTWV